MVEIVHPSVDDTPRVAPRNPGDPLVQYLLFRRHLFAYETAAARVPHPGLCLDIGAGLGYGISLLAGSGKKVMAMDLSEVALRELSGEESLSRIKGDATKLPFADGSFDAVVAFQLVEHVSRPDAARIVSEMRRVLRRGGKGFITTPNARWRLLPGERPRNPHHQHEFTPRSMLRFIDEAGLPRSCIEGVVGKNGAQEIERARVAPSILKAYGGPPGRVLSRAWRRLGPRTREETQRLATVEDAKASWFELSSHFSVGLDFFLEFSR